MNAQIGGDLRPEDLRSRRERAGLSQELLARKAGLSSGTVRRIEGGNTNPTRGTLRLLAQALSAEGA
jgi:transcriptional regulator with XRE-family HTH domain